MKQAIINYIESELPLPAGAEKLVETDDLLTVGRLSSMQFMRLIQFIEQRSGINVPPEDMVLENFQTVALIDSYLTRRTAA